VVNKMNHIRYSGSPIPLSFSEYEDKKQVIILEFRQGELLSIVEHEVPCCRKLVRIKGSLDTVKSKILLLEDEQLKYPVWVEVQVETEGFIHDLEEQLDKLKEGKAFIDRFFPRQINVRSVQTLGQRAEEVMALADLNPKAVFLKKCEAEFGETEFTDLVETFNEVLELMAQKES